MKFKKQRDEEEQLERAAKIKAHLDKGTASAAAAAKAEPKQSLVWPPLRDWERLDRWGRREQFRPMTSREVDQENDRHFLASQFKQDADHAKKVAAAEADAKAEHQATQKRAAHESVTGRRAYEPSRYISLEEARQRGYLASSGDNSNSGKPEWYSPENPEGLLGGGR